jgi:hypothetical protein
LGHQFGHDPYSIGEEIKTQGGEVTCSRIQLSLSGGGNKFGFSRGKGEYFSFFRWGCQRAGSERNIMPEMSPKAEFWARGGR